MREFRLKPNGEYTDGYSATWINDTIVRQTDSPDDSLPYVKFSSIEVPGRFWSVAMATLLRDPQIDLNMIRTQIKENARLLGNPAIMVSRQADVRYSGVPGERIDYNSSVQDPRPEYLQPPNLPPYVENEVERIEKSIEEISGIHEVSRATVPTGVTAASAINLLQEADDSRLGPEIQAMEFSIGQWGSKILKLRAKHSPEERLIKIAGEDGNWDIEAYRGEMLGEDPHVEVQAGSQMPRSKAAKQAGMTEILGLVFQYGVPIDERNLRKFLKDYEIGGLDRLFEGMTEDAHQVNRENRMLLEGVDPGINTFDDHEFHLAEHTEFQKTSRYYGLPDQIKEGFDNHVTNHRMYMMKKVENQMETQSQEQQAGMEQEAGMEQQTEMVKAAAQAEAQGESNE